MNTQILQQDNRNYSVNSCNNLCTPLPQSNMESYITASIDFLKNEQKIITTKIQLNTTKIGVELSFIVTIPPSTLKLKCLIDTGCSNTILYTSMAEKINLTYKPFNIIISTATADSEDAVQGITHTNFQLYPTDRPPKT